MSTVSAYNVPASHFFTVINRGIVIKIKKCDAHRTPHFLILHNIQTFRLCNSTMSGIGFVKIGIYKSSTLVSTTAISARDM